MFNCVSDSLGNSGWIQTAAQKIKVKSRFIQDFQREECENNDFPRCWSSVFRQLLIMCGQDAPGMVFVIPIYRWDHLLCSASSLAWASTSKERCNLCHEYCYHFLLIYPPTLKDSLFMPVSSKCLIIIQSQKLWLQKHSNSADTAVSVFRHTIFCPWFYVFCISCPRVNAIS